MPRIREVRELRDLRDLRDLGGGIVPQKHHAILGKLNRWINANTAE
jgi:hypothetical protein